MLSPYLHRLLVAAPLVLVACHPATTPSTTARNLAADAVLLQVFEKGDVSRLDSIIAPGFVNHAGLGDQRGLAAQKAMVLGFHQQMPNVKMRVIRRWADDDYVSDWLTYTGAASGKTIEGIEVTRYARGKSGKAVEHWFFPSSRPGRP